jgi:OOP family OmpA-OmpF porin
MKKIIMGVVMVLLAVTVTAGHAQVREGSFSVTPFVGWYNFEGNEDLKDVPVYGLRGGYNFTKNLGLEGFFNYVQTESTSLAGNPVIKLSGFGIEGLYHFMPESRLVPFLAVGVGGGHYRGSGVIDDRNKLAVDYGAGLKYFLTENLALRADVRHINPFNDHYNEFLYTVGLNIAFGGAKKALPEVMATRAAEPAAPVKVVKDTDGDGVVDDLDKCPGTPAGVKVDQDGCPLDSDGDGVPDYLDKCPGTPAGVKVDRDGCPLDSDGDGVPDYLDKCPGTPAGVNVDQDGCAPITLFVLLPDRDGKIGQIEVSTSVGSQRLDKLWESTEVVSPDRIPGRPKVMDEKEARNIFKDALEAQPKPPAVFIIYFKSGGGELTNESLPSIPEILEAIKAQKSNHVRLIGHTDTVGSVAYNRRLSQIRAKSVADVLVSRDVDRTIIEIEFYGKEKLLIETPDGVAEPRNRRVEIIVK